MQLERSRGIRLLAGAGHLVMTLWQADLLSVFHPVVLLRIVRDAPFCRCFLLVDTAAGWLLRRSRLRWRHDFGQGDRNLPQLLQHKCCLGSFWLHVRNYLLFEDLLLNWSVKLHGGHQDDFLNLEVGHVLRRRCFTTVSWNRIVRLMIDKRLRRTVAVLTHRHAGVVPASVCTEAVAVTSVHALRVAHVLAVAHVTAARKFAAFEVVCLFLERRHGSRSRRGVGDRAGLLQVRVHRLVCLLIDRIQDCFAGSCSPKPVVDATDSAHVDVFLDLERLDVNSADGVAVVEDNPGLAFQIELIVCASAVVAASNGKNLLHDFAKDVVVD